MGPSLAHTVAMIWVQMSEAESQASGTITCSHGCYDLGADE